MDKIEEKAFLSISEACRASGLSRKYIDKLVHQGRCPGIKIGNAFHINYPLFIEALNKMSKEYGNENS